MPIRTDIELAPGLYRVQLEPTPDEIEEEQREQAAEDARAEYALSQLADITPAQAAQWVENNWNDPKLVAKIMAKAIVCLAKNILER